MYDSRTEFTCVNLISSPLNPNSDTDTASFSCYGHVGQISDSLPHFLIPWTGWTLHAHHTRSSRQRRQNAGKTVTNSGSLREGHLRVIPYDAWPRGLPSCTLKCDRASEESFQRRYVCPINRLASEHAPFLSFHAHIVFEARFGFC